MIISLAQDTTELIILNEKDFYRNQKDVGMSAVMKKSTTGSQLYTN